MDTNKYLCFICKTTYDKRDSFNGFNVPVDDAKRLRWSQSCGVHLPVYARVCENHFTDIDFIAKASNKMVRLMPEALPKPVKRPIEANKCSELNESSCILIKNAATMPKNEISDDVNEPLTNTFPNQAISSNFQNLCCICRKTLMSDKVALYSLPANETYRRIWCEKLGKNYPPGTQICGNHFRPNDFLISNKQYRLKEEAIPSQNLKGVSVPKPPVKILFLNQTPQIEHVELPSSSFDEQLDVEEKIKTNITRKIINISAKVTNKRKSPKVCNTRKSPKFINTCKSLRNFNTLSKSSKICNTTPNISKVSKTPPKPSKVPVTTEISNKSVQTDVGYARTCGFIEVSLEHKVFSMNCFYCEEAFPIWSWGEFVTHVREQHQREEDQLKKECMESNEIEKPIQPITKGLVYGFDSDSSHEKEIEKTTLESNIISDVKEQPVDTEDHKNDVRNHKVDNEKEINFIKLDSAKKEFISREDPEIEFITHTVSNKTEINYIEIDNTDMNSSLVREDLDEVNNLKNSTSKKEIIDQEIDNADIYLSNSISASLSSSNEDRMTDNDDEDYVENTLVAKKKRILKKPLIVPCYLCERLFTDEFHLKIHQQKTHGKEKEHETQQTQNGIRHCKICNKTVKAIYYSSHLNKHKPAIYDCEICGKQFQWKYTLNNHLKTHSNQRDYVCEFCGTGFLRYSDMYEHKQRAHSDEKNYRCDICGYTTKTSTNLCVHRKKYHLVLEGSIEELSRNAYRPPGKTRYEVVEDPETKKQRFKCDLCDNTYALLTGMSRHRQQVHGIIPPKRNYNRNRHKKYSKNEEANAEDNLIVDDCNLFTSENDENYIITDMDNILNSTDDPV